MKVLKINRKLKNEKQKEYKKELKQINKTIMDIFPIIDIVEDKSIFKTTYGYMNILQIESKDIYSLNIDEVNSHVLDLTSFLRGYQDDIKIVCMQFPVNTYNQQQNIINKLENSKNPNHRYFLEKRLNELKFLEEYRQNKEFYLFFFAENEKAIFERENLLLRLSSDSMKLKKINNEKRIKILFKLNNQNSKT